MNRKTIRNAVGLPDDDGKILGLVSEDPHEICENTIGYGRAPEATATLNSQSSPKQAKQFHSAFRIPNSALGTSKTKAKGFDFGASGGSTSPNTEVNADSQGVISEVPRGQASEAKSK